MAALRKAAAERAVVCQNFDEESYPGFRRQLEKRDFKLIDESNNTLHAESKSWGFGLLPPLVCCVLHNDDEVIRTFAFDKREDYPGYDSCPFTPSKEPPP